MTSPCRRHFQKVRAAQAAATTEPAQSMAGATAYELQLLQLTTDRARLKQIQSEQGKAELKRELLPAYQPYVEGVLSAGQGAQDEVLTTVMVWRMDAGDYTGALDIADYVLRHGLVMPDRFARTTGCLVAEEIANAALKAQKAGGAFDLAVLERTQTLTQEQDMPDEARAKLLLATARATLEGEAPGQPRLQIGIDLLKRAIDLHGSCGGKKDLERAERLLKNIAAPAAD
ncbi:Phage P2 small terminase subunit gpM-like protein [Azotobacter vinelandii CA]|uniref:Phage P2 small terminase subunit gpM-like protein n=2 Tax=Azotobacter vinelandii TaxID=354 RepID=C1DS27_AZOVD|nr:terminase endonuclease subunit [Azotobacter vinelandii]ACO79902.1 Phage P2 small terminase subunit gpM-like protein [Azotobacter vinelandii DJ]AGK13693.1 Phage P2 small terminase subunit gpM-like protein [Azotobacter vinelandii CA]AGK18245.1 Phage P2 small terminase subunit gpM-like protein [Azotobacter vinelandii CA6]SFX44827.1 Phage small terminase subunit [Azotobacter vinelandii]GLK62288.1 terminase [Azotobacter vinelandii]